MYSAERGILLPHERLKYPFQKLLADANARIFNHNLIRCIMVQHLNLLCHGNRNHAAGLRIGNGVICQIQKHLFQFLMVAVNLLMLHTRKIQLKFNILFQCLQMQKFINFFQNLLQVALHFLCVNSAGFRP